jgi:hypothetical protein
VQITRTFNIDKWRTGKHITCNNACYPTEARNPQSSAANQLDSNQIPDGQVFNDHNCISRTPGSFAFRTPLIGPLRR